MIFQFVFCGKGKAQGKSLTAETVIWLSGDTHNGRKLMPIDIRVSIIILCPNSYKSFKSYLDDKAICLAVITVYLG